MVALNRARSVYELGYLYGFLVLWVGIVVVLPLTTTNCNNTLHPFAGYNILKINCHSNSLVTMFF